jgi:nucleotide-binding universal stress UspA family protein
MKSRLIRHPTDVSLASGAARALRADVIVMGTRGPTGLFRLLMGRVAERVVGTAPCPVLAVQAR